MAKVILVGKTANSTAWRLAQALKSQQHDVVFLTSYGEDPVDNPQGIEILSYFKSWSVLEGLRILPGLFGLQPQILHLVLDEDRMNAAQVVLSTFARSHPACVLTTSLLNIKHGLTRRNPVRYLIEESDIITFPSVEILGHVRGLNVRQLKQGRGILPPVFDLKTGNPVPAAEAEASAHLESFTQDPFVVVPLREARFQPESDAFHRIRAIAQKYKVLLWGSYAQWPLRDRKKFAAWMAEYGGGSHWAVTGLIDSQISSGLLAKSRALILAGQVLSPVEITEFYMRAIQSRAVLVLDSKQAGIHSGLWEHGVNCWILNSDHLNRDLLKLLAKSSLDLPQTLSDQLADNRHLMDSSLNELNRLYNRALNQLR